MLGRQRMYFMLPDVGSARGMLDELLLSRIEFRHIQFMAKNEVLPEDLPEASFWHKTDLTHGAGTGMQIGGLLGLIGGVCLVAFPSDWINLSVLSIFVTTFVGIVLGGWMSGMAAMALPNSRLKQFQQGIEAGKILLIVDVPFNRKEDIASLLEKCHPEAKYGGLEPHIPVFP